MCFLFLFCVYFHFYIFVYLKKEANTSVCLSVRLSGRAGSITEKAEASSATENAARTSHRTDGTNDFIYKMLPLHEIICSFIVSYNFFLLLLHLFS
jgi:hypothetical protein